MTVALILVPAQYEDNGHFLEVAKMLKRKYVANSVIFKVIWDGKPGSAPDFSPAGSVPSNFSSGFWGSVATADTFISISHCGWKDGPMIGPGGEQPWPSEKGEGKALTSEARGFWSRVSWGLGDDGRMLIAGCDSADIYGPLVAKLMSLKVFGFSASIGAAVPSVADLYIGGYFLKNRTGVNVVKC